MGVKITSIELLKFETSESVVHLYNFPYNSDTCKQKARCNLYDEASSRVRLNIFVDP